MKEKYGTFSDFWPFYVSQHLNRTNRILHFVGTTLGLVCLLVYLCFCLFLVLAMRQILGGLGWDGALIILFIGMINPGNLMWIPLGLLLGYGFAWAGHYFFEKNKPATFKYPLWSLKGDLKMYILMWRGMMDGEVARVSDSVLQLKTMKESAERDFAKRSSQRTSDVYGNR